MGQAGGGERKVSLPSLMAAAVHLLEHITSWPHKSAQPNVAHHSLSSPCAHAQHSIAKSHVSRYIGTSPTPPTVTSSMSFFPRGRRYSMPRPTASHKLHWQYSCRCVCAGVQPGKHVWPARDELVRLHWRQCCPSPRGFEPHRRKLALVSPVPPPG